MQIFAAHFTEHCQAQIRWSRFDNLTARELWWGRSARRFDSHSSQNFGRAHTAKVMLEKYYLALVTQAQCLSFTKPGMAGGSFILWDSHLFGGNPCITLSRLSNWGWHFFYWLKSIYVYGIVTMCVLSGNCYCSCLYKNRIKKYLWLFVPFKHPRYLPFASCVTLKSHLTSVNLRYFINGNNNSALPTKLLWGVNETKHVKHPHSMLLISSSYSHY